jgi:hypothetical protein
VCARRFRCYCPESPLPGREARSRSAIQANDSTRKGVDCKYCDDKRALPQHARHLPRQNKQKQHRHSMRQNICEMMSARVQAVQLVIQHLRERRQRVPVLGMNMGEAEIALVPLSPSVMFGF